MKLFTVVFGLLASATVMAIPTPVEDALDAPVDAPVEKREPEPSMSFLHHAMSQRREMGRS